MPGIEIMTLCFSFTLDEEWVHCKLNAKIGASNISPYYFLRGGTWKFFFGRGGGLKPHSTAIWLRHSNKHWRQQLGRTHVWQECGDTWTATPSYDDDQTIVERRQRIRDATADGVDVDDQHHQSFDTHSRALISNPTGTTRSQRSARRQQHKSSRSWRNRDETSSASTDGRPRRTRYIWQWRPAIVQTGQRRQQLHNRSYNAYSKHR